MTDRFILILAALCALMAAYAINVDRGMAKVQCGPNGLGGKTCVHVP